jgi:hypothetical protein
LASKLDLVVNSMAHSCSKLWVEMREHSPTLNGNT